ncbi:MAG: hypothetical protein JNK67_10665 [Alphaproteobacteria bacterium]|nr:hypothetical protein [Alphaproteobacteria bacterium]
MKEISALAATMEPDNTDRVLSPRAALLVCAAAALVGWLGVAGLVYVGKIAMNGLSGTDIARTPVTEIAPAAGPQQGPAKR